MGIDGSSIASKKASTSKLATKNLTPCRICGKSVSKNASSCPHCGEPMKAEAAKRSSLTTDFTTDKILALSGSAIIAIGVFSPVIKGPFVGSMNYFGNGEGDGVFLLSLAAVSVLCVFINKMQYLWITALASLGMLGYSFYQFKLRMSAITEQMDKDLAGNPFRGLADAAMGSVSIQWGWALLVLGAILVLAAAGMSQKSD